MAALYTRTYTFLKQTSWTSEDRIASWSDFTVSGDTDKNIGYIVSITYEHYNNSHSTRTWELQGGLVLGNGTVIYSNSVAQSIKHDTPVLYVNEFQSLPTVSQFNSIVSVCTYANGSYIDNNVLTWRANSSYPMKIIVAFYEEEPLVYKPTIEKFSVVRGTSSGLFTTGTREDDGTSALFTLKLNVQNRTSLLDDSAILALYYSDGTVSTSSSFVSLQLNLDNCINGYVDVAFIQKEIKGDEDYEFMFYFEYGGESTYAKAYLDNNFVAFHISSIGSVSIGDISHDEDEIPKFEVHHPSYFKKAAYFEGSAFLQGGISQIQSGSAFQYGILSAPITVKDSQTADQVINFSPAFSDVPCLFITPICSKSKLFYVVTEITQEKATVRFFNDGSGDYVAKVQWLAISGGSESEGGGTSDGTEEGGSTTVSANAITGLSFNNGRLSTTLADGKPGSTIRLYEYDTVLPTDTSNYSEGDLFFLI